jgi:hypothetical protein
MSGFTSRSHEINPDSATSDSTLGTGEGRPRGILRLGNIVTSLCILITRRWRGKAMVYVQRDAQGKLLRVEPLPFDGMSEPIAVESEELQNWLKVKEEVKVRLEGLHSSDLELVRVLEDVVNVLVDRGVIQYTDLPEAARAKLDQRAVARADIEGLNSMLKEPGE